MHISRPKSVDLSSQYPPESLSKGSTTSLFLDHTMTLVCSLSLPDSITQMLREVLTIGAENVYDVVIIMEKEILCAPEMELLKHTLSSLKNLRTFLAINLQDYLLRDLASQWSQKESSNLKCFELSYIDDDVQPIQELHLTGLVQFLGSKAASNLVIAIISGHH